MTRFFAVVLLVVALAAAGFYVAFRLGPDTGPTRTLDDTRVVLDGTPTTCSELFDSPCSFDMQTTYNRYGPDVDDFVRSTDLGPYARAIGVTESARLLLEACMLIGRPGQTSLEFVEHAQVRHADVGSPDLFPFWNRASQGLCAPPA